MFAANESMILPFHSRSIFEEKSEARRWRGFLYKPRLARNLRIVPECAKLNLTVASSAAEELKQRIYRLYQSTKMKNLISNPYSSNSLLC